ncbi:MAG: exodeoxyribonuclease V subunit gamma [Myxococcota bacterium]|jgi:exodeoxyribonuclease V gamma subunit|nr:exodeoxyribonuclease V subunit gamma [Myxococcota bacterium]
MSGFFLHRSNRMERLAERLAAQLPLSQPADPITPWTVVVGSRGMERWLRHELADRHTVCANVEFLFPGQLVDRLGGARLPDDEAGEAAWEVEALRWAVARLLPELLGQPAFDPVGRYLRAARGQTPSGGASGRDLALTGEIAELLDHYLHYRRDWIEAWLTGTQPPELASSGHAAWQLLLLQRLVAELGGEGHFVARMARLERLLQEGALPGSWPTTVHLFGVSSLPPPFVDLLGVLSSQIRVELYLFCPSDRYWGDLRTRVQASAGLRRTRRDEGLAKLLEDLAQQSPLLTTLGRVSRDMQIVLEEPERVRREQELPYQEPGASLFVDPAEVPGTLLQQLQSDLLHLRSAAEVGQRCAAGEYVPGPGDTSLLIHSCHGPLRQVEALRDTLLGLLTDDPSLQPRDILVMTPDIETYAPLIRSVFAQGRDHTPPAPDETAPPVDDEGRGPRIPFAINDISLRRSNPLADVLLRILELAGGRLGASEVIDLLSCWPVARRFGLDDHALDRIRGWVADSGIRWGIDPATRQRFDQPAVADNTWESGLQRLLFGVVMPDEQRLVGEVLPFDDLEGEVTELLGTFVAACNLLFARTQELLSDRSLAAWCDLLETLLDEFCAFPRAASWLGEQVREEITALRDEAAAGGFTGEVSLDGLRQVFAGRCEVPAAKGDRPITGAVTVCALSPMRSVPFRVIALLGLDDGVFPRSPARLGLDLMHTLPRIGDRDPRDEDRHLLLEALLSCRQSLQIFFTGHDVRTNESLPPAVPVAELLDQLALYAAPTADGEPDRRRFLVEHPLQPFSPAAFRPGPASPEPAARPRPASFDGKMLQAARQLARPRLAPRGLFAPGERLPPPALVALPLDKLVAFFKHPARHLLQERLGVFLRDDGQAELVDREPIELSFLEQRTLLAELGQRAAQALRQGAPLDAGVAQSHTLARARGMLPLGTTGKLALEQQQAKLLPALRKGEALLREERTAVPVALTLEGLQLVGAVPGIDAHGGLLLLLPDGPGNPKAQLEAWIRLLAAQASEPTRPHTATLLGVPGEKDKKVRLTLQAPAAARELLAELVGLYVEGLCRPLPFFPKSSLAFAEHAGTLGDRDEDPKQWDKGMNSAREFWAGSEEGAYSHPESGDAYYEAVFGDQDVFAEPAGCAEFTRLARRIWQPILQAQVKEVKA